MDTKHKLTELLTAMLQLGLSIADKHELHALGYAQEFALCYDELISPSQVITILAKMDSFGFTSLDDFRMLQDELFPGKNGQTRIQLIAPYHNRIYKREFSIHGTSFSIIDGSKMPELVPTKKMAELFQQTKFRKDHLKTKQRYIVFTVDGRNAWEGWRNAQEKLLIYQGLYDWSFDSYMTQADDFSPLTKFRQPDWVLGKIAGRTYDLAVFDNGKNKISPTAENPARKTMYVLLHNVQDPFIKNSTREIMADCLRLFAMATSSGTRSQCFSHLWQLIDVCCMVDNGIHGANNAIMRFSIILRDKASFNIEFPTVYSSLVTKRKILQEKGIDLTTREDINMMRIIAGECLIWLLMQQYKIKSRMQLAEFFELSEKSPEQWQMTRDTIALIKKKARQSALPEKDDNNE